MRISLALLAGWILLLPAAHAQWTNQTFQLRPGWNAIYLELDPAIIECDAQFAGLPVESVWAWNKRFSSVQFIQDPDRLVPGQPEWLTWLPPGHSAEAIMNLFTLRGGSPYLVKLRDNAPVTTWTVRGRPGVRTLDWISDSYNFVGFSVNSASPPTFQSFFNGSPSHAGKPIYRLNVTSGLWELVGNPGITTMRSGEAFWIRCDGRSTYSGPVQLTVPGGPTLDYGRQLTEQALHFKNLGTNSRTLTLRVLTPGAAPAGSWAAVAGQIPFSYFRMNLASNEYGWFPLPPQLSSPVLPSGGEWMVRLEARRRDMVPWAGTIGPAGATYQALLEVQDGLGWCQLIAVTADGLVRYESAATLARNGSASRSRFRAAAANSPLSPYAGLWIGHAVIRKVSQPSHLTQPEVPLLVASPLQYRLLLHVDAQGEARLLQRVLQMWKNGTLKPDPANPSVQIVDEPGRFVLVTDERLVPNFSGATLRDGVPVGRRLSTVAYALAEPLALTRQGSFGDVNSIVAGSMSLDYDHPLNPFKHRYHPDHDNLDEGFRQKLAEGQESFTIGRDLSLQFTAADPDNLSLAGWGDNQLGGVYRETLRGVHKRPIYLEGTFRLYQAVRVSELNDGL